MSEEEEVKEEVNEETTAEGAETTAEGAEGEPAEKKPRKKWPIVVGVIVVVVVVAVIGMLIWHEQPSFCSAFCHTPMDEYLETYESELGEETVDKYGNTVEDSTGMLSVVHAAEGITCLGCHTPTLSEQINEGIEWVMGNYSYPLTEKSLADLVAASGIDEVEFCLNEDCHDLTEDELAAETEGAISSTTGIEYNPHEDPHDDVDFDCSDCHKAHRASVLECTECHTDMELPDGWITVEEESELTLYESEE